MKCRQPEAKDIRADFWREFVNKRVVDCVHPVSQRMVFRLQFDNFFFQLLDFLSYDFPLFARGARATVQHRTGDLSVLGIDSFTTAA